MKRMAFVTLVAMGVAAGAVAQQPSQRPSTPAPRGEDRTEQVTFEQADKNQDSQIDRIEAEDIDGLDFSSADVDANTSLSRQEFETAMSKPAPPIR